MKLKSDPWLPNLLSNLKTQGWGVVQNVLSPDFLSTVRSEMYKVQSDIKKEVGEDRLTRAGEEGVLRLMMKFSPVFLKFLELPQVLAVVDQALSPTAILHLQNGFILPSKPKDLKKTNFQYQFHQDFPRVFNGYVASINVFFAIDEFRADNGGTLVVPGSHQKTTPPSPESCQKNAVALECPAGSMFVFDSTLWHAAGSNTSGKDRLAINHQFTRSFLKQQLDYVRALGPEKVSQMPTRTQQLLGYFTRVPASLDQYYQPEEKRFYRRGQG